MNDVSVYLQCVEGSLTEGSTSVLHTLSDQKPKSGEG